MWTSLAQAQHADKEYFDAYWQTLLDQGGIPLRVPPEEEIWRRDLGRARRIAFEWLGDLRGKRVLELGCGPGDEAIMMARRGAHVTAIDVAPSSVQITAQRAVANGESERVDCGLMAGEALGVAQAAFDWVVGFGFLHHANVAVLAEEVRRVLRPEGRALFFEPLGMNPLLEFARNHLPYRGKHHSSTDRPLQYAQLRQMGSGLRATRVREFYLFSMITRAVGGEMSLPFLWTVDEFLIRHFSFVRRLCRYVLVEYAL